MKKRISLLILPIVAIGLLLLSGCGSGSPTNQLTRPTITNPTSSSVTITTNKITVTAQNPNGKTVNLQFYLDSNTYGDAVQVDEGQSSSMDIIIPTSGMTTHTITVQAQPFVKDTTDTASTMSAPLTVITDVNLNIVYPTNNQTTVPAGESLTVTGTANTAGDSITVELDTTTMTTTVNGNLQWDVTFPASVVTAGSHMLIASEASSSITLTFSAETPTNADGTIVTTLNNTSQTGAADGVAIDSLGNIIAVGVTANGGVDSIIASYSPGGELNFTTPSTFIKGRMVAIALNPDDSIIVAGDDGSGNFQVQLYTNNYTSGTLTQTITPNGSQTVPGTGRAVAIQDDGNVVVVGNDNNGNFQIARFLQTGGLDTTFGNNGVVTGPPGNALAVAIDTVGNIVVGGTTVADEITTLFGNFQLYRYTSTGAPDTTFNSNANPITPPTGVIEGLVIQTDGNIVAAGAIRTGLDFSGTNTAHIIRYLNDGSLDGNFNSAAASTVIPGIYNGVVQQFDGKLVTAGSNSQNGGNVLVARYTSSGAIDTTFNMTGTSTGPASYAQAVALQADGTIIAAGNSTPDSLSEFLIVSFNNFSNYSSNNIFTVTSPKPGYNSNVTPPFSGTAPNGSIINLNVLNSTSTVVESGATIKTPNYNNWSLPLATTLSDGTYTLDFTGQYKAGNLNLPPQTQTLTIQTNNTTHTTISTPSLTATVSLGTISGTATPNSTVQIFAGCQLACTQLGTTTADSSGNWSYSVCNGTTSGTFSITAIATDQAGNSSAASNAVSVMVTCPPGKSRPITRASDPTAITIMSPANGSNLVITLPPSVIQSVSGTAAPNSQVHFFVDGNPVGGVVITANADGQWSAPLSVNTPQIIKATATDPEGNVTSAQIILNVMLVPNTPPTPSPISDLSLAIRAKYCGF